jgi:peptidoglycan hydrolase-like protein with peptidoglycan-binding domain
MTQDELPDEARCLNGIYVLFTIFSRGNEDRRRYAVPIPLISGGSQGASMALKKVTYDLVRGMLGADVARLQIFLNSNTGETLNIDGVYGVMTFNAVKRFQANHGLPQDGQCGGATLKLARDKGYAAIEILVGDGNEDNNWPAKPKSSKLQQPTAAITQGLFGSFSFTHAPTIGNPQKIKIGGTWVNDTIVTVKVPQLIGVPIPIDSAHAVLSDGKVQCHKLAGPVIIGLFQAWEDAGLASRILTWYGCFNARLKRKTVTPKPENLSNHSWGSAFDINAPQNWLGELPTVMGGRGCVRELVSIANEMGVYWGGHFGGPTTIGSRDGMHFEIAKF